MTYRTYSGLLPASLVTTVLALSGCGGGGGGSASIPVAPSLPTTGSLTLDITDAPVHDAVEVWIQFTGVSVKPASGDAVSFTYDEPKKINLMSLTDGKTESLLSNQSLEAGAYNWIRLDVDATADGILDSYVLTQMGEMIELSVPSQQGLQLSSGFTITQSQISRFIIDWDLNKGLVAPKGQDGWKLRPSLRIVDQTNFGEISGSVAESLLMDASCANDLAEDTGNTVYVYSGNDVTPDDITGGDTDPLVTAEVKQDVNGIYTYKVSFLSPGDYTVALTCQALSDDPEVDDEIVFSGTSNATVTDDNETAVNFE